MLAGSVERKKGYIDGMLSEATFTKLFHVNCLSDGRMIVCDGKRLRLLSTAAQREAAIQQQAAQRTRLPMVLSEPVDGECVAEPPETYEATVNTMIKGTL